MDYKEFELIVKTITPNKADQVLKRFQFDYGFMLHGLNKKKVKTILFHVNYIFKLGNTSGYTNPLYKYRLTSDEVNKIMSKFK